MNDSEKTSDEEKNNSEKLNSFKRVLEERYVKELRKIQSDIHLNQNSKELREESGNTICALTPEYQAEFDSLNEDIDTFKRAKYPELFFKSENIQIQEQISLLKDDLDYKNLIKGIDFFSADFDNHADSLNQIENLVDQIFNLIMTRFPELLLGEE